MSDEMKKLQEKVEELERQVNFMKRLTDDFTKIEVVKHEVQYKAKVYDANGNVVIN